MDVRKYVQADVTSIMNAIASDSPNLMMPHDHVHRTRSLSIVVDMGMINADYLGSLSDEKILALRNSDAGYSDLCYERFTDQEDETIPAGSTISLVGKSAPHLRFYIMVLPKANLVIYDKFPPTPLKTHMAASCPHKSLLPLLGLQPCWQSGNATDLTHAAALFGFEMHRRGGYAIIDPRRTQEQFKAWSTATFMMQFLDSIRN